MLRCSLPLERFVFLSHVDASTSLSLFLFSLTSQPANFPELSLIPSIVNGFSSPETGLETTQAGLLRAALVKARFPFSFVAPFVSSLFHHYVPRPVGLFYIELLTFIIPDSSVALVSYADRSIASLCSPLSLES